MIFVSYADVGDDEAPESSSDESSDDDSPPKGKKKLATFDVGKVEIRNIIFIKSKAMEVIV